MNRLQLAILLSWTDEDGIRGRKRLQKVVFFLQQAGCPLECRFTLYHFGPYSKDVADACDEMVAAGLIDESGGRQEGSMQYSYRLKVETREMLRKVSDPQMQPFTELGKELISKSTWLLELGSTILFFYRKSGDWDDAMRNACEFKRTSVDAEQSLDALELARSIATWTVNN